MTSLTRWRIACAVLAVAMVYMWWHRGGHAVAARRLDGPLRASASALGISTDDLIRQMFKTRDVDEFRRLAERLAIVGDDDSIDAVLPLVADPRPGVPEAVIAAFGAIATDHAVDVLIARAADPRDAVKAAAVEALGHTRQPRAVATIARFAGDSDETIMASAIQALGELGTDEAVAELYRIALVPTSHRCCSAVSALGKIDSNAAREALVRLIDAPVQSVAREALEHITKVDPNLMAKLTAIIHGKERDLVAPAISALAQAGDAAFPLLRDLALHEADTVQRAAIEALADLGSAQATATLGQLLASDDVSVAKAAASALATVDNDAAREIMISAALADRDQAMRITQNLMEMTGPDVEQALLVIAKGNEDVRTKVLAHLMRTGSDEATSLAIQQAHATDGDERFQAMKALADADTPATIDTLLALVRAEHGPIKADALELLGHARPGDPQIAKVLGEAVRSGTAAEQASAIGVLGKFGTDAAREALVDALASSNTKVVEAATDALAGYRLDDTANAALRAAAGRHPSLADSIMIQLVENGSPLGLDFASAAVQGDNVISAIHAITALREVQTRAAFDVLARGAHAQDAETRAQVMASLASTSDKRSAEVAQQGLNDANAAVRWQAARSLGTIGTPQARDALIDLSRSQDGADRVRAVNALTNIPDARTTGRLVELLRDPDPNVASGAVEALSDRGSDATRALRDLMRDGTRSASLRTEAATQLRQAGSHDPMLETFTESRTDDGADDH